MNPFSLSALMVAGAVAATLLAVVLLYLLRPPARRMQVASNLIWQRVLEAYRRVSDRWRWWLSLLIASVVSACIVLALVRPATEGNEGRGKIIVVVDNAPTMATLTFDGVQRFNLAKQRAVELIEGFVPATRVMIVDTQRRLTTPAFESPRKAIETVTALQLGQSFEPIVPSVIASIAAERRYVVTDGVLLGTPPPDFETVSVFEAADNLGITAFDFDNVPGEPTRREAFVEVFNAGSEPRTVEVVISGIGEQRVGREILVEANSVAGQTFDLSVFTGGPIRAALTGAADAYPDDDVAYGYLSSRRIVRVTLVSSGAQAYLAKSLSAQPRVSLRTVAPRLYADQAKAAAAQTDIFVFDRFVPEQPPPVPALFIGSGKADWLPARAGVARFPEIVPAGISHPVLRNISLGDLYIEKGNYLQPQEDPLTTVLLRAADDKVLAVAHDGAMRWVLMGFDVADSNFGLLSGFPLFLGNSIKWLADESEIVRASPGTVAVPFVDARVLAMDGNELPVVTVDGRSYFEATQPGLYTAFGKDRPLRIAINLLERRISDINQSALNAEPPVEHAATEAVLPLGLSALLLIIAAALLCIEWLAYHRRVTV